MLIGERPGVTGCGNRRMALFSCSMRRLLGLLILLYGLLLALNTTAPTLAKLTSERALATVGPGCTADMGSPPFGGLYGSCPASLPGMDEGGRVFGDHVSERSGSAIYVHRYPLVDSFAVIPPSNTDQVAGIIAVLIVVLGILLLVAERRRGGQSRSSSGDSSDGDSSGDPDDGVSSSVGESGGGGDGGGGNGGD
jgi:hypothetical protein